jgi:hypothetical protein
MTSSITPRASSRARSRPSSSPAIASWIIPRSLAKRAQVTAKITK